MNAPAPLGTSTGSSASAAEFERQASDAGACGGVASVAMEGTTRMGAICTGSIMSAKLEQQASDGARGGVATGAATGAATGVASVGVEVSVGSCVSVG